MNNSCFASNLVVPTQPPQLTTEDDPSNFSTLKWPQFYPTDLPIDIAPPNVSTVDATSTNVAPTLQLKSTCATKISLHQESADLQPHNLDQGLIKDCCTEPYDNRSFVDTLLGKEDLSKFASIKPGRKGKLYLH